MSIFYVIYQIIYNICDNSIEKILLISIMQIKRCSSQICWICNILYRYFIDIFSLSSFTIALIKYWFVLLPVDQFFICHFQHLYLSFSTLFTHLINLYFSVQINIFCELQLIVLSVQWIIYKLSINSQFVHFEILGGFILWQIKQVILIFIITSFLNFT